MNIDGLKYGNPTKQQSEIIKRDVGGLLKRAIESGVIDDMLKNHPFPKNSSDTTKKELEYLKIITDKADSADIRFYEMIDTDYLEFFEKIGNSLGIDVDIDMIQSWIDEIDPITFYLKDKYNRVRPYQLSDYLGIELRTLVHTDANSAAYPSGHTIDFLVIMYNFIKLKPEIKPVLNTLYKKIRKVRELSGVHYPSDTKVSEILVKKLIEKGII